MEELHMLEKLKKIGFKHTLLGLRLEDKDYSITVNWDKEYRPILTVNLWAASSCLLQDTDTLPQICSKIKKCKAAVKKYVREIKCKKV